MQALSSYTDAQADLSVNFTYAFTGRNGFESQWKQNDKMFQKALYFPPSFHYYINEIILKKTYNT